MDALRSVRPAAIGEEDLPADRDAKDEDAAADDDAAAAYDEGPAAAEAAEFGRWTGEFDEDL